MSRVVWGAKGGDEKKRADDDAKQPRLDGFVTLKIKPKPENAGGDDKNGSRRRERPDDTINFLNLAGNDDPFLPPLPPATQLSSASRCGSTVPAASSSSSVGNSAAGPNATVSSSREASRAAAVSMMLRPSAMSKKSTSSSSCSSPSLLQQQQQQQQQQLIGNGDDGVQWGPSGGGNRETMKRKAPRPFMMGKERSAALNSSPYSRDFAKEWSELRSTAAKSTTEMDPAIVAAQFEIPESCPRTLFAGKIFFLNSMDSDALFGNATSYNMEKLIRHLGGTTSMGISQRVDYIITQHLASSKTKLLEPGRATKCVHPHFVLACAKAGRLVSTGPFEIRSESSSALRTPSTHSNISDKKPQIGSLSSSTAAAAAEIIEID